MQDFHKYPPRGGKIVYDDRQNKAMTVNKDVVEIHVPLGKRWLLYWGYMTNNSGVALTLDSRILDTNDIVIGILNSASRNNGETLMIPFTITAGNVNLLDPAAFPVLLNEGQGIRLSWPADAGKSGTSRWYLMIQEFTP